MLRAPYVSFTIRSERPGRVTAKDIVSSVLVARDQGHLPFGSRLPPVRALETQLGLSKNTVQSAYDELVARGVLEAREREGVFVAQPAERSAAVTVDAPPLPRMRPPPSIGPVGIKKDAIALSTVFIDPSLLPREKLADCARSILKQPGMAAQYDAQGFTPLREAIAQRLSARGMEVSADEVIVTTGSQQALDLIARAVEVRRVAMESPVYGHAKMLFENLGLQVTGLRFDPFEGIPLDRWEEQLSRARPGFLYSITSFQNPTGYSYSTHELLALLEMSRKYDFALVEDDWGSDMLSGGEYRPTLRQLGGKNVTYVNSFTKKLLPSLRIGFLVADRSLIPSLVSMKRLGTLGNAWLTEAIVAEFLERGYYDGHLATLQEELDRRYAACLEALSALMPEGVRWTTPGGGPTLWLETPRRVVIRELEAALAKRGVQIESTNAAFSGEPHLNGFRVSYAYLPPDRLRNGLEILADELKKALG